MGCITCRKCREIMPGTLTQCLRCSAYNVLNESDSYEEKKEHLITAVEKLLQPLQVAFDQAVQKAQNVTMWHKPLQGEATPPNVFTARLVENANARGSQPDRAPKTIQWKREFV